MIEDRKRKLISVDNNEHKRSKIVPPLTLKPQVSLFDRLVLKEPVDLKVLDQLIEQNKTQWLLPRYKALIKNGKANVEYTKPLFGRAVVKGSIGLHNMEKSLRHALANPHFIDWDMSNAHPTLLLQVCQSHDIVCKELRYYVENRESCLTEVMTRYSVNRDQCKQLFLRMMFLGGFAGWAKDCGLLQTVVISARLSAFSRELSSIATTLTLYNPEIAAYIREKGTMRLEASVLSTFLQELECRVLETLIRYCIEKGLIKENVAVLCNDGFMLETSLSKPELATDFSRLIRQKHGIELEFVTKPMNKEV